ncbi:hypothetical protein ACM0L0_01865 [Mycoplasma sp. 005V]
MKILKNEKTENFNLYELFYIFLSVKNQIINENFVEFFLSQSENSYDQFSDNVSAFFKIWVISLGITNINEIFKKIESKKIERKIKKWKKKHKNELTFDTIVSLLENNLNKINIPVQSTDSDFGQNYINATLLFKDRKWKEYTKLYFSYFMWDLLDIQFFKNAIIKPIKKQKRCYLFISDISLIKNKERFLKNVWIFLKKNDNVKFTIFKDINDFVSFSADKSSLLFNIKPIFVNKDNLVIPKELKSFILISNFLSENINKIYELENKYSDYAIFRNFLNYDSKSKQINFAISLFIRKVYSRESITFVTYISNFKVNILELDKMLSSNINKILNKNIDIFFDDRKNIEIDLTTYEIKENEEENNIPLNLFLNVKKSSWKLLISWNNDYKLHYYDHKSNISVIVDEKEYNIKINEICLNDSFDFVESKIEITLENIGKFEVLIKNNKLDHIKQIENFNNNRVFFIWSFINNNSLKIEHNNTDSLCNINPFILISDELLKNMRNSKSINILHLLKLNDIDMRGINQIDSPDITANDNMPFICLDDKYRSKNNEQNSQIYNFIKKHNSAIYEKIMNTKSFNYFSWQIDEDDKQNNIFLIFFNENNYFFLSLFLNIKYISELTYFQKYYISSEMCTSQKMFPTSNKNLLNSNSKKEYEKYANSIWELLDEASECWNYWLSIDENNKVPFFSTHEDLYPSLSEFFTKENTNFIFKLSTNYYLPNLFELYSSNDNKEYFLVFNMYEFEGKINNSYKLTYRKPKIFTYYFLYKLLKSQLLIFIIKNYLSFVSDLQREICGKVNNIFTLDQYLLQNHNCSEPITIIKYLYDQFHLLENKYKDSEIAKNIIEILQETD